MLTINKTAEGEKPTDREEKADGTKESMAMRMYRMRSERHGREDRMRAGS